MWFIGVEVERETSAPPPKKNPGSAPEKWNSYIYDGNGLAGQFWQMESAFSQIEILQESFTSSSAWKCWNILHQM